MHTDAKEEDSLRLAWFAAIAMCRRFGKRSEARVFDQQALAIARQEPERRFLEKRLTELA